MPGYQLPLDGNYENKKHTVNIARNIDEPSNDCDRTGEPTPLPDGDTVVGNRSGQTLKTGRAHSHAQHDEC
jgi:hypothetical protein